MKIKPSIVYFLDTLERFKIVENWINAEPLYRAQVRYYERKNNTVLQ